MKPRVALIGPGRVGQSITALLRRNGYPIGAVVGRNLDRTRTAAEFIGAGLMATTDISRCASAQLVLLAVGDDQIETTAQQLFSTTTLAQDCTVIHFSGLHCAAVMRNDKCNCRLLSLHPLHTFAAATSTATALAECYFAIEGDTEGHDCARQLVEDLGGNAFFITAKDKPAYHAAACMASNFITTILDASARLLAQCGSDNNQIPLAVMAPLIKTAVTNTITMGAEYALTGPVVRGDCNTIASHLQHIHQPQLREIYTHMVRHTIAIAQRSHRIDDTTAYQLEMLIDDSNNE